MTDKITHDVNYLIKIGEEKYMTNLINNGELYFNTLSNFRKNTNNKNDLRTDEHDGACYIKQLYDINIDNKYYANKAQLYYNKPDEGIIYCMYSTGSHTKHEYDDEKEFNILNLKETALPDSNKCVIIYNVNEFIKRIKNIDTDIEYHIVRYYDHNTEEGELDIFDKSDKYKIQNEVRFYLKGDIIPKLITIGDISDISKICDIDDISMKKNLCL